MVRRFRVATTLGLLMAALLAAAAAATATGPGHAAGGLGARLVNRYFSEIKRHDTKGLRKFLSPAFQVQRADGSRQTKREFIHSLPTVISYKLRKFATTSSGGVLVVTYQAAADEVINGKKFKSGYAPRLSVFSSRAGAWQLMAHANFNAPS